MNIQRLNQAVESDEMNSPLITICNELANQGYVIKVEDVEFSTDETSCALFTDLEKTTNEFDIEINKNGMIEKFKLVFTEYHRFNIENCGGGL
jgi:hypothetical protein